jgi:hypothetical protein
MNTAVCWRCLISEVGGRLALGATGQQRKRRDANEPSPSINSRVVGYIMVDAERARL